MSVQFLCFCCCHVGHSLCRGKRGNWPYPNTRLTQNFREVGDEKSKVAGDRGDSEFGDVCRVSRKSFPFDWRQSVITGFTMPVICWGAYRSLTFGISFLSLLAVLYQKVMGMTFGKGLPHFAAGKVVKGFGRGSKDLGIPTGRWFRVSDKLIQFIFTDGS